MNCKEFLELTSEQQSELIGTVVIALQYDADCFKDAVKIAAKYDSLQLPHKPILMSDFTHEIAEDLNDIDKPIEKGGINY